MRKPVTVALLTSALALQILKAPKSKEKAKRIVAESIHILDRVVNF